MKIQIIECVSGEIIDKASTWDKAYALRDQWQEKAMNAGFDLTKRRYAIRCD